MYGPVWSVVPRYRLPVKIDGEELLFVKSSDVLATHADPARRRGSHAGHH